MSRSSLRRRTHPSTRRAGLLTATLLLGALQAPALAQPTPEHPLRLDYRLGLAVEHSDNIRRSRIEPQSETTLLPNLAFALSGQGERFSLQAAGDAEIREYREASYDSELRTRLGLSADWRILPGRLSWSLEEYLGRQPVDAFAIDRPDNQQRTHVMVTGPSLSLRPSAATRLLAELRWIDTWAQRSREFNGERWNLALRGLRQFSPSQSGSLHIEYSDAGFDRSSASVQPFERFDGFLRWDRRAARLEFAADAGFSRIDFDGHSRDRDGSLLRLRASWLPSDAQRFDLQAARHFSDAVADLVAAAPRLQDFELAVGLPSLRGTFLNPDIYRETRYDLGYVYSGPSLSMRLLAYRRDQDYALSDSLDQQVDGGSFGLTRVLRPRLSLAAYASFDRRDYRLLAREDRDSLYGLSLRWQLLRRLQLELGASRARRSSSEAGQDFEETRYLLGLLYRRDA